MPISLGDLLSRYHVFVFEKLQVHDLVIEGEQEGKVSSLILVEQEKESLAGGFPGVDVANAEHIEHEGALDCAFGVVAHHLLVVHLNALRGDWVSVPVMFLLTVASRKLQKASHHLLLTQVVHIVQVDQDLITAHFLEVDEIMDWCRLSLDCGSLSDF